MAQQVVKLKRTSVQGKIPTVSNLELGELAINTFDGRLFFEKDNGVESIQEILTTNSNVTGSLNLNGAITSSTLLITGDTTIDGNLTIGGNITIGDSTTDSVTISAELSGSLIPDSTDFYDLGSSTKKWNKLYVVTSSADYFIGDGSGLTNLPTADVSQVATVTSSFDNTSSISVSHNFNTKNVIISVYQSNDTQIIPQSVTLTNNNTVDIILSGNHSGYVVVAKGGHIVSGSADDSNQLNGQPGSYYLDYTNFTNTPITTYKEDVSGNSTYTITHNLNEEYPIVQSWNTSTNRQEVPSIVESLSLNSIEVTFSGNFSGRIIVKK